MVNSFIKVWSYGQAPYVNLMNRERIGWPHIILFAPDISFSGKKGTDIQTVNKWRALVLKISKNFGRILKFKYRFAIGDKFENKELVQDDLQVYQFEGKHRNQKLGVLAAFKSHKHRWVLPVDLEIDLDEQAEAKQMKMIENWIRDLQDEKLDMHIKSQEDKPIAKRGQYQEVTARTFENLVNSEENKDIMIWVHANFCSHCRLMKPAWETFAKRLMPDRNLKVMAIEGFYNDLYDERYRPPKGFPAVFFKPKGKNKDPIEYPSDRRTAQDFINWLYMVSGHKKWAVLPADKVKVTSTEKLNNFMEGLLTQTLGPLQPMQEKILDILEKYTQDDNDGLKKLTQEEADQKLLDELEKTLGKKIDDVSMLEKMDHDEL